MTLIRVVRHPLAHERFWDSFIPRTSLPQVPPYPRRYGSYQKFCQTSPACGFQGRAIHSTTNRVIYFPSVGWIWFCICDLIFSSPMASDSACKGVLCSIYVLFFFFQNFTYAIFAGWLVYTTLHISKHVTFMHLQHLTD